MSEQTLAVGIDISKYKHDVAVMAANKKLVCRPFVIREQRADYELLVQRVTALTQRTSAQTVYFGMEATADYWKNLYFFLKAQPHPAFRVVVINPVQTKAFAKAALRRAKTDVVNAQDIARYLLEKLPAPMETVPPVFSSIQDVDKQLHRLSKLKTMLTNRLRAELGKVAPEIERHIRTIDGQQILALLAHYPTAEALAAASPEALRKIRYGKKQWPLPIAFIERMQRLAHRSIAHKKGAGAGLVVQSLVRSLLQCQSESRLLKEQIKELYAGLSSEQSLLATIPGIGLDTAIVMEAYLGDVSRFPSAKQIVAYFGLNPTVSLSGIAQRKAYLEKKGCSLMRHKLFLATLRMISAKQEPIFSYYQRLVAAGKPKLVAITAAMRKLLVIMYHMMKNKQPFKTPTIS